MSQEKASPMELQPGEHVAWKYGSGEASGRVVEKLTGEKNVGSRVYKASPAEPRYLVRSDKSGKEAVKRPETLHRIDESTEGKTGAEESAGHGHGNGPSSEEEEVGKGEGGGGASSMNG